MDIQSRINHWQIDQQRWLMRIRDSAIATITEQPLKTDVFRTLNDRDKHPFYSTQYLTNQLCNAGTQIQSVVMRLIEDGITAGRMPSYHIATNYTLYDIHTSANFGCHLCSILEASTLRHIKHGKPSALEFDRETMEDTWVHLTTKVGVMNEMRCDLKVGLNNMEIGTEASNDLTFISTERSAIVSGSIVQDQSKCWTSSTGSDVTLSKVMSWLTTCINTHEVCRSIRPVDQNLPRRLLHLLDTTISVIENTQQHPYVCLSHCWGGQTNTSLKLITPHQQSNYPIASLPKSFRDAIEITKRLGHTYLWIDCFCIVQDSRQDWLEQSAVMAQIYANSILTIAALAAKDPHDGCFQTRNPLMVQPLRTPVLTVEPRFKNNLWRLEVEGSQLELSPLHTRAWVMQERLASPRTVYFGSTGVFWECRCIQASESHEKAVEDITDNIKTMLSNLQVAALDTIDKSKTIVRKRHDFLERWQRLLEMYTTCSLTHFSDRLVALSGITRDIEKYSGKSYVQGLWRDNISTGLLWCHHYPSSGFTREDNSGRIKNSGFPSWSWASTKGQIQYINTPGKVIWTPGIEVAQNNDQMLNMTTWRRKVNLLGDNTLTLVADGSKRGDLHESHHWYHDEKEPEQSLMEIALVQRASISETPYLRAVRCLVITCVDPSANVYQRVGLTTIRFNVPRDDPFPPHSPPSSCGNEVVLI